jgi:hypothetical protein
VQILDSIVKTERQKVVEKLESELTKAANAKHFVESTEGQYVIDYLKHITSDLVNQITNKRLEHFDYIEKRAKIDILRRVTQVLETQSNEQVIAKLNQELDLAQSED